MRTVEIHVYYNTAVYSEIDNKKRQVYSERTKYGNDAFL